MFMSLAALSLVVSLSPTNPQQHPGQQVVVPQPVQLRTPALVRAPAESSVVVQPTEAVTQPAFGHRGQKVFKGSTSATFLGRQVQTGSKKSKSYGFAITPEAGIFVANHLYIGSTVDARVYGYNNSRFSKSIAVGPAVGFYTDFSPNWGVFPTLSAIYKFGSGNQNVGLAALESDGHQVCLGLRVDAVVHLSDHFSMTVGPYVSQSFYNQDSSSVTNYGINAGVLGWM